MFQCRHKAFSFRSFRARRLQDGTLFQSHPFWAVFAPFCTVFAPFRTIFAPFCAVSDRSESFSDRFERRTLRKVRENLRKLRENSAKIRESLVLSDSFVCWSLWKAGLATLALMAASFSCEGAMLTHLCMPH